MLDSVNPDYPGLCGALEVKTSPAVGRHVTANKDISVGELLGKKTSDLKFKTNICKGKIAFIFVFPVLGIFMVKYSFQN